MKIERGLFDLLECLGIFRGTRLHVFHRLIQLNYPGGLLRGRGGNLIRAPRGIGDGCKKLTDEFTRIPRDIPRFGNGQGALFGRHDRGGRGFEDFRQDRADLAGRVF